MKKLFKEFEYCVFDFETTGFDPQDGDQIIEVGGISIVNGELHEEFHSLVNPHKSIPPKIQNLTGITNAQVSQAPSVEKVLPTFLDLAKDRILIAHNIPFDLKFLQYYSSRAIDNPTIDSLKLSRKFLASRKNNLDYLVNRFNLNRSDDHRALEDARATSQLFKKLTNKLNGLSDYWRGNIPIEIVKEDLSISLRKSTNLNSNQLKFLERNFDTTSELLQSNFDSLPEDSCLDHKSLKTTIDSVECWYDSIQSLDDIQASTEFWESMNPTYWTLANWIWITLSTLCLMGVLLVSRAKIFMILIIMAATFFLISPMVTIFRGTENSFLKQCLTGGIIFVVAIVIACYLDI